MSDVEHPSDAHPAIEATGLTKSYGGPSRSCAAWTSPSRAAVHALLGPNGAGKTTAVRILATLSTADAGTARVAGHDIRTARSQVRRAISLTGQFAAVDEMQTGTENLRMMARLARHSRAVARTRAAELLDRFDLTDAADRLVKTYSGGMRRRLDLAASLVGAPRGDLPRRADHGPGPTQPPALWDVVRELSAQGTTVFLTTQYLEEADRLADRIAVLDKGSLVAEGTSAELKQRVAGHRLDLVLADSASYLHLAPRATYTDPDTRTAWHPHRRLGRPHPRPAGPAGPHRTAISSFSVHTATLDDVFLNSRRSPAAEPARV